MQNLRWKIITILAVLRRLRRRRACIRSWRRRYGITSPSWLTDKQLKLGLDLKGGVHLVLRVQTDDALRIETEAEIGAAARGAARRATSTSPTSPSPRRPSSGSRACRPNRTRRSAKRPSRPTPTSTASPGAGGTYTFTHEAEHPGRRCAKRRSTQARQTIERRVNELGVTEPSIAAAGQRTAIRFWCSCPA